MKFEQRLLVLLCCFVGLAIAAIAVFSFLRPQSSLLAPLSVTKTGVVTCLPHKKSGPHTLECAFGLKTDDGTYYSLQHLPENFDTAQARVIVTGTLLAPDENNSYDIIGNILVHSIQKQ